MSNLAIFTDFDKILLTGGITALSERVNDHSVKYVAGPAKELELLDPYDPNVVCSNQSDYRGQIATEAPTGKLSKYVLI